MRVGSQFGKKQEHQSLSLQRKLNTWTLFHSFICLFIGGLIYNINVEPFYKVFAINLAAFGAVSFMFLFLIKGNGVVNLANLISLTRLVFGQIVILMMSFKLNLSYLIFSLLVCAGLTDAFDGFIARKKGVTAFGAKLDMEIDAFFMFILAIVGFLSSNIGSWLLLIGLIRYGYVFLLLLLPPADKLPGFARLGARAICGFSVIALISITAPFFTERGKAILNKWALILLSFSFMLDLTLHFISPGRRNRLRT